MDNTSKTLTPEESLKLIGKFVANYRKNYQTDSIIILLWGWVITLASISHFIILRHTLSAEKYDLINILSGINWSVFVVIGYVIQYITIKRL